MRLLRLLTLAALTCAGPVAIAQQPAKTALTPDAFDGWRSIRGATISNDGR
jgi:hypothetical protein